MEKRSYNPGKVLLNSLVMLIFAVASLSAGTTGKLAGKITDKNSGDPLIGANISLENTSLGSITDQDGVFFVLNIPPGTYNVVVSYVGYKEVTTTDIQIKVDRTTRLNLEMEAQAVEGESVTVVGQRDIVQADLTATERVVSSEDFEKSWVRSLDEALDTKAGVSQGHFRGGLLVESVYNLDGVNLNSGILSDNYKGINTSSVEEVAVLTGGFNAEYGNAQSAIINVVSKQAASGIHGSAIVRMRPAGKYHFGRNMFSQENYDYANHDLAFWTEVSQDQNSEFFGVDPNQLLNQWREQITPDAVQADYADKAQYETEVTLYGAASDRINFLVSGRYLRGIGRFPQVIEYNPEFNLQGNFSFKINNAISLDLKTLHGGYENSDPTNFSLTSNFNSLESAKEGQWYNWMAIRDPYAGNKYHLAGAFAQWPEKRRVTSVALDFNHVLSPKTFYELGVSVLVDTVDKSDRIGAVDLWRQPGDPISFNDDELGMLSRFTTAAFANNWDRWKSQVITAKGSITSQMNNNHLVKAGFTVKSYDFYFEHVVSATEGARWNLLNVFDGQPIEIGAYLQDKIEFSGMIVNAGLRLDMFDMRDQVPENMFDPLAFQEATAGNVTPGLPGNPVLVDTDLQVAVSPRVGVSHPVTENTVLHFQYGHFNQRPSWNKMFGFPFISFQETADLSQLLDPYFQTTTYMDQWQGFQGNPLMSYQKTVQYEIGLVHNISDAFRLDATAYYKDGSRQAQFGEGNLFAGGFDGFAPLTLLNNPTNQGNVAELPYNGAFTDLRGVEIQVDTYFNFPLNFSASYDMSWGTGGVLGFRTLNEGGFQIDEPQQYGQSKNRGGSWTSNQNFKANAFVVLDRDFGPEVAGFNPLGDVTTNLYYEFWTGPKYTYHGPGDVSTEPNNRRWDNHHRWNLKFAKRFGELNGLRPTLSVDVRNLFNNKDLNLLGGADLTRYEEEGILPIHSWSQEPNEWNWYSLQTNPPREIFLQLQLDF